MTDIRTRPTTRLAADRTVTQWNLREGADQVWSAASDDGVWLYVRVEDGGTPWEITHLPTGATLGAGTLLDGRRRTADAGTLEAIREQAARVVARGGGDGAVRFGAPGRPAPVEPAAAIAQRLGKAMRVLAVLDGLIGAGRPAALCGGCGGYLAEVGHADACRECLGAGLAERRECRNLSGHVSCARPFELQCDHRGCLEVAAVTAGLRCLGGLERCCGCCR